ncbi:hypothetical protein [Bauldia litoralis]|uniref:Inhibitor of g-type lysozyme n=1 Tax=Bauldia litoralis TaxID=665467 RepID=A0A1G6B422_9HYPH|nr:hypothetical protein [Bauldia litoralis]SDB15342.1 hypothetical protein SAMN02982931_01197 [Bauldia litoralis]
MKVVLGFTAVICFAFGATPPALAAEQDAIDGCIDKVRATGGPDAAGGGEVLSSEYSEAGTLVRLRDAGGTVWECIAYDDGAVGDLRVVEAADDGEGAMAGAEDHGGGARAGTKVTRVEFEAGNDNASKTGKITGHGYHDYVLGARAGQRMGVSLITKGTCYFNIEAPGSDGAAIYNGSMDGPDAVNIKLPKDGDYTIRVYLMGNDRDSGATVHYQLSMTIM